MRKGFDNFRGFHYHKTRKARLICFGTLQVTVIQGIYANAGGINKAQFAFIIMFIERLRGGES